ncbi:DUF1835 domain-containing protein [Niallia sp. 03133]|uniref:DUF1835 domain-containing protein n=1 Tax=Niallia sp. 03133 TaxID=3458060 RepID=UPI0040449C91
METRCIYPFIYFYSESVVFVYEIKTEKYIRTSQLIEAGDCTVYELKDGEEFAAFNHEDENPVTGSGFVMSEEGIAFMIKEVNRQIVNHKKSLTINNGGYPYAEHTPVHLAASESAAGSLRVALDFPKKVIGLSEYLAVGPIKNLHTKSGQAERFEWLFDHINTEISEFDQEIRFTNTLAEIAEIPEQSPIYIWYGNNSAEQTALRFLLFLLAEKTNDIHLVHIEAQDAIKQSYVSMFQSEKLKFFFEMKKKEKKLSNEEKACYIEEWKSLEQSREVLRIWQHNEICSVSEQYFDAFLLKIIETIHEKQENKAFIKVSTIIGEAIDTMEDKLSDSFIEYRIRDLVYGGVLKMKGIPKSIRHYRVMLK